MVRQAVILCGGVGSRLGELTKSQPKPLLPVGGVPFLDHLFFELGRQGISRILLLGGFEGNQIRSFAEGNSVAARFGISVEVVIEEKLAGTGGAVWNARDYLDSEFVLLNGDSWFDFNLLDLMTKAASRRHHLVTFALRWVADASRYGLVALDEDGQVTSFAERPPVPCGGLVNGGVALCRRGILDHLSPMCSLEGEIWPRLASMHLAGGQAYSGYFIDIGVPADFARSDLEVTRRLRRPAVFLDRDGVLNCDLGHVGSLDRFYWIEGAKEAVKFLNDSGFFTFVVTNQAGIAKGYYLESDVVELHRWMQGELNSIGAHLDDFRFCPFHPDAKLLSYQRDSSWRKPGPGMLLDLVASWPVQLDSSFLVGDKQTDLEAATSAGVRSYLFDRGRLDEFVRDIIRFSLRQAAV
jgi:D,D-heptose 1,7-bisphosphate phosphatase